LCQTDPNKAQEHRPPLVNSNLVGWTHGELTRLVYSNYNGAAPIENNLHGASRVWVMDP